ncbi:MAG: hypothetical protein GY820_19520, partial [Gammaproteobacteria bacterium]|nr:hypothetical protein [Gammaproteobacteria bacterium]
KRPITESIIGGKAHQHLQRVGIGIDRGGNNATSEVDRNREKGDGLDWSWTE